MKIEQKSERLWSIDGGFISFRSGADGSFVARCSGVEGLALAWSPKANMWSMSKQGVEVCSLLGSVPSTNLLQFLGHESLKRHEDLAIGSTALGIMSMPGLPAAALRRQVGVGIRHGEPLVAFAALASGADMVSVGLDSFDSHPVLDALARKTSASGRSALTRPLAEVRAWLSMLESFGASVHYRDEHRGKPDRFTAGQSAAWSTDAARQAALERGVDFAEPLKRMLEQACMPGEDGPAISLTRFLAESGTDEAKVALKTASDEMFDKRDRERKEGRHTICQLDAVARSILSKGRVSTFFALCEMAPRIDRDEMFLYGVDEMLGAHRWDVCKGARGAIKFSKSLRALKAASMAAGMKSGALEVAFGKALAGLYAVSTHKAWEDAQSAQGFDHLDLSFMDAKAVAKGVSDQKRLPSSDGLGALDVEFLIKAGVEPAKLAKMLGDGGLGEQARAHVELACARQEAAELRRSLKKTLAKAPHAKRRNAI
jgi:hypothetical protein